MSPPKFWGCGLTGYLKFRSLGGEYPSFKKNALGVKRPFSELSESSGVFSEQLSEYEIPFSEYEIPRLEQHENHNSRNNSRGAIPGIHGNPHERASFSPAFSERFFKNWGGPRAPEKCPPRLEHHSFQYHYISLRKPFNHVTVIAENSRECLRGIISCYCSLLEQKTRKL